MDEPIARDSLVAEGILVTNFTVNIDRSLRCADKGREMRWNRLFGWNKHSMRTVWRDYRSRHAKTFRWFRQGSNEWMRFYPNTCPLANIIGWSASTVFDFYLR